MRLIRKLLLCVIEIYSKYESIILLKDKKQLLMLFETF